MRRIIAQTALAGLIAVAVLLLCAGMTAGVGFSLDTLLWLLFGAVITILAMALTFVLSWLDMDTKRSKRGNVRSISDRSSQAS